MLRAGAQVLADGEDVGAGGPDRAHRLLDLRPLLAQADHDAALGEQARALRAPEQLQRAAEAGAGAHLAVQARHRLRVVVQDVGPGGDHGLEGGPVPLEVRDQDLHRAAGHTGADLTDAGGEDARSPVTLIVTVDGGDHRMAQAHARHRVGHAAGLLGVGRTRGQPGLDRAEPAGAGAYVTQDHEGRGAAVPAVADIGTAGLLAYGVEVQSPHQIAQPFVALADRRARLDPLRPRKEKDGSAHATLN